ncbi:PaaI family thioesterase [Bacillus taeanensis]|uniref:PaaI family thioesterase n=1 Tax=Bacillus taeanensis TaxID=273032 RepID=A0A366XWF8_9BACI|nr:PaaI family thioesterase [Bacillus taeanensis]RBW70237.1 PaaI family thioesterase [Bacillus taeanensis]
MQNHLLKEKTAAKFKEFLTKATDEELILTEKILNGLQQKQQNHYVTYLDALCQMTSQISDDSYEVIIPIQPLIYNKLDIVHGGITATLADTAMGSYISKLLPENKSGVTTELKINYLAPGKGKFLKCTAAIIHKGKQLWVAEAKIYNDSGKLAAVATGSFYIVTRTDYSKNTKND